jgi:phosphonate transport system substrate-binding protein
MQHNRRTFLALAASAATFTVAGTARAQEWKSRFRELTFAVVPAENASGVTERYAPLAAYWSKELGVPVKLRIANDYAAVIEGQRSGQIHIGFYGPAAFARALKTGVRVEAFAQDVNLDGTKGYFSVFYVKKDAPYRTIQDLRGRNLGLVDPNSASGYNVPLLTLDKMGIDAEKYFGKVLTTGSHENAVLALHQGTVDVAVNWYNDENQSNLLRMARKNMVKAEDFRIILKSEMIVNSPWAYLADLPADLKRAIASSFYQIAQKDPAAFEKATDGKAKPWEPVTNAEFRPMIELIDFVDKLKRRSS